MKSTPLQSFCLVVALLYLASQQKAGAVAYRIDGFLTDITLRDRADFGMAIGDAFSALWTFDDTVPDAFPGDAGIWGQYESPTSFQFSVNGLTIMDYEGTVNIWVDNNPVSDGFYVNAFREPVTTAWGVLPSLFDMGLVDRTERALTSDALQHDLGFSVWPSADLIIRGDDEMNNDVFKLNGKITATTRVSDAGSSALLLGMALAGCALARKVC